MHFLDFLFATPPNLGARISLFQFVYLYEIVFMYLYVGIKFKFVFRSPTVKGLGFQLCIFVCVFVCMFALFCICIRENHQIHICNYVFQFVFFLRQLSPLLVPDACICVRLFVYLCLCVFLFGSCSGSHRFWILANPPPRIN